MPRAPSCLEAARVARHGVHKAGRGSGSFHKLLKMGVVSMQEAVVLDDRLLVTSPVACEILSTCLEGAACDDQPSRFRTPGDAPENRSMSG